VFWLGGCGRLGYDVPHQGGNAGTDSGARLDSSAGLDSSAPGDSGTSERPATHIWWTEGDFIMRSPLSAPAATPVIDGGSFLWDVEHDPRAAKLMWSEDGCNCIRSADRDGGNQQIVASDVTEPQFAVDPVAGNIYWVSVVLADGIFRAPSSGGAAEAVVSANNPDTPAVDLVGRLLYYTQGGALYRAALDGSGATEIAAGIGTLASLVVDSRSGHLYWAAGSEIRRLPLAGGTAEAILSGLASPQALALDPVAGRLYWREQGAVRHAGLAGENPTTFIVAGGTGSGIALE
jgi:hypothetical protein